MNILSRLLLKPSYLHKVFTKYITKNHIQCWKETNKMLIYNKMMAEKIGSSIFLDLILLMILCYLIKTKAIERNNSNIIILLWDRPRLIPALDDEKWDSYFIYHGCRFQNCIITAESKFLSDIRDFDVIIFNSMIINETVGPETRSQKQNYVFFSDEPAAIYKVPKHFNGYFNMTWTYKLNSDATWRFMIVKNDDGEVIGPKENVMWTSFQHMKPTSEYIIQKLQTKHIAAAWFVTHCKTPSNRENMVERLINELDKYDLKIDIFGPCGSLTCTQNNEECHAVVESDYYFYLAFENSLCEDYVTEKILTALKHYTVPVVYGGADYSRYVKYIKHRFIENFTRSVTFDNRGDRVDCTPVFMMSPTLRSPV